MSLKVLIADDNTDRANEVARYLRKTGVGDVILVRLGESLTNAVAIHSPDVVIVDMSRPDRDSLENVRTVTTENPRPIVMFVDHSDVAFMEAAIEAGVSSYNVVGSGMPDVRPIVQAAVAMFRRHQQVAAKLRAAEIAATLFYDRLFTLDPKLRLLFKGEMKEQGRKLMAMIGAAVRDLDQVEALVPVARGHAGYGVSDAPYDTVASAPLWTLEHGLGPDFTPKTREAWTACYMLSAGEMKKAAAAVQA